VATNSKGTSQMKSKGSTHFMPSLEKKNMSKATLNRYQDVKLNCHGPEI
jgi:hypothetical protein